MMTQAYRFQTVKAFMEHLDQKRDIVSDVYRIYSDEGDVVLTNGLKRLAVWSDWNITMINCVIHNNQIIYKIFVGW